MWKRFKAAWAVMFNGGTPDSLYRIFQTLELDGHSKVRHETKNWVQVEIVFKLYKSNKEKRNGELSKKLSRPTL